MTAVWLKSMWWNIFQSPNAFKIQAWEHPPSGNPIAKQRFPTSDLLLIETYSKTETRVCFVCSDLPNKQAPPNKRAA